MPTGARDAGAPDPATAARAGTLLVAGAPIGRPEDASPRLARALAQAEVIAAEDTRRVRRLATALGVRLTGQLIRYDDYAETGQAGRLLGLLRGGQDVLLVSDAGMPAISDPGYRVVAAAAAAGIAVTVLPGPSAATTALAVSGLPSDRFCFEGFLPPEAGKRDRRLAALAAEPRTLIFFATARNLAEVLTAMAQALGGQRRAVACRELTKTHEEIRRGTLAGLAGWAAGGILGEVTLVVEGGSAAAAPLEQAVAQVAALTAAGISRRDAVTAVAVLGRLSRRALYNAVVGDTVAGSTVAGAEPPPGPGPGR